ncbi:uncharacterized protein MONOS_8405c1 [Monocercomonoides exilis]|uniref:uncharacterized protein n=1 Tax=Monocercomonoides exilis TaxID=2049356 RepID=UPI0035594227|nr:hypothetical protein MONOS_8405c2 [Monocercomonoides exilis]KAH7830656.1 hypothetical protein MONOS_8405c1 [Monocercomonoides exilis]|eukprot:MONOS_8405.1-p1 / transcript=MONOS_8405.1 / gene=MONOS_8405 / organism=Monocercomonoides_exilis_PA203 / gene_product=unspecified product / transcript_product=unspecified product / location=Mono_scaffold00316:1051-1515(-) / protein_length=155 / sequence_SO=supercontig / SO=protein_coding / is_pseudo=false
MPEDFTGDELSFFLYCSTMQFEGKQHKQPMNEKEDFLTISFRMFRNCSNTLFEGASEKKIKMFWEEFEGLQSEKGEADASVFLGFLLNYHLAEAVKWKEAMRALYDSIRRGEPSTPSSFSLNEACRGITFLQAESLLCVLSADSKGAVDADLPG